MILFKAEERAIFVHGFAKNDMDNIGRDELAALKKLAREMLAYGDHQLRSAVASGTLIEVKCNGEVEAIS